MEERKVTFSGIAHAINVVSRVGFTVRKDIQEDILGGWSYGERLSSIRPKLSDEEYDVLYGMLDVVTDTMGIDEAIACIPMDQYNDINRTVAMAVIYADWAGCDASNDLAQITLTQLVRARGLVLRSYPEYNIYPEMSEVSEDVREHILYVEQSPDLTPVDASVSILNRSISTMLSAARRVVATAIGYRHELTMMQILHATARLLDSTSRARRAKVASCDTDSRVFKMETVEAQLLKLRLASRLILQDPADSHVFDALHESIHGASAVTADTLANAIRSILPDRKVLQTTARYLLINSMDKGKSLSFHQQAMEHKWGAGIEILFRMFDGLIRNVLPATFSMEELWGVMMIAISHAPVDEFPVGLNNETLVEEVSTYRSTVSHFDLMEIRVGVARANSNYDIVVHDMAVHAYGWVEAAMMGRYIDPLDVLTLLGFARWRQVEYTKLSILDRKTTPTRPMSQSDVTSQPPSYVISAHNALLSVRDASHSYVMTHSPDLIEALETITKYLEANDLPYSVVFNKNN